MPNGTELEIVKDIATRVSIPFYHSLSFWIEIAVGLAGLFFSLMAFREARRAREAAREAGRTVKVQTVAIELGEISQRLDRIETSISFAEARDMISEVTRRVRRIVSPFAEDKDLKQPIANLKDALEAAKAALSGVRPTEGRDDIPQAVYFAIEGYFANVNNIIADLLCLLEKQTISEG